MKKKEYWHLEQTRKVFEKFGLSYKTELQYPDTEDECCAVTSKIGDKFVCLVTVVDTPTDEVTKKYVKLPDEDEMAVFGFYYEIPTGYKVSAWYKKKLKTLLKKKTDEFIYIGSSEDRLFVLIEHIGEPKVEFCFELEKALDVALDKEVLDLLNSVNSYLKKIED